MMRNGLVEQEAQTWTWDENMALLDCHYAINPKRKG